MYRLVRNQFIVLVVLLIATNSFAANRYATLKNNKRKIFSTNKNVVNINLNRNTNIFEVDTNVGSVKLEANLDGTIDMTGGLSDTFTDVEDMQDTFDTWIASNPDVLTNVNAYTLIRFIIEWQNLPIYTGIGEMTEGEVTTKVHGDGKVVRVEEVFCCIENLFSYIVENIQQWQSDNT